VIDVQKQLRSAIEIKQRSFELRKPDEVNSKRVEAFVTEPLKEAYRIAEKGGGKNGSRRSSRVRSRIWARRTIPLKR